MNAIPEKAYNRNAHGNFADEWLAHKRCQDWWYCTGIVKDNDGKLYSYQFTILRLTVFGFRPHILMLALTDFTKGSHYYYQTISLSPKRFTLTPDEVAYGGIARAVKKTNGMALNINHSRFALDLELEYGKGAVWHCDGGNLVMGTVGGEHTTQYYSYTNMPTRGTLILDGNRSEVSGKTWFDRQYGLFPLFNRLTHWEWFSLRFDDDEEAMLFSFPQVQYQDGTYIRKDGSYERLTEYTVKPTAFIRPDGRTKYSCAWEVSLPGIKKEEYTVKPLLDGQMNTGYFELLAGVFDINGERVGYCFVELLPGVHNKRFPVKLFSKANQV